jgi:CBS domain containing-hemolysin-like protein
MVLEISSALLRKATFCAVLKPAQNANGRNGSNSLSGPGRLANEYVHFSGRKVRDVMTYNVWTVTLDASLAEVVHLMERHNIKRIPVVEANKIVGIVTRANLLHAMASFVHEVPASSIEDAAIREQLLAVLETQSWTPAIDVAVRNG